MFDTHRVRRLAALALVAAVSGGTAACDLDDVLEVERPGTLTTDELAGPTAIPLTINGIIGDFTEMMDGYALNAGLFTDEFILGGTFPTREEIDRREIDNENASVRTGVLAPLNTIRFSADNARNAFQGVLDESPEGFDLDLVGEGLAFAQYYAGFARLLLGELYCEISIDVGPYNTSNQIIGGDPTEGVDQGAETQAGLSALDLFELAEASAAAAGLDEIEGAAILGQARAHMWMGDHDLAAADAARVPDGFEYVAEYSSNSTQQWNEVSNSTWGISATARWTIGWTNNNTIRRGEEWAYFQEWVDLGLITVDADVDLFNSSIPAANAPNPFANVDAPILIASSREGDLYRAEAALRAGDDGTAEMIVNGLRADWGLGPIDLTAGTLANWGEEMAREYAREMWINGHRQHTLRRFYTDGQTGASDLRVTQTGIDLYPPTRGLGVERVSGVPYPHVCFPTEGNELDNNDNPSLFPAPGA